MCIMLAKLHQVWVFGPGGVRAGTRRSGIGHQNWVATLMQTIVHKAVVLFSYIGVIFLRLTEFGRHLRQYTIWKLKTE